MIRYRVVKVLVMILLCVVIKNIMMVKVRVPHVITADRCLSISTAFIFTIVSLRTRAPLELLRICCNIFVLDFVDFLTDK